VGSELIALNLGGVNCYLLKSSAGFLLVDSGYSSKRRQLVQSLERAGCRPGDLKYVLLTHGDSDHAGNAAFLQKEFHALVGMHPDDFGMVERGDMNWNRKPRADKMSLVMKVAGAIVRMISRQRFETFKPDLAIDDGREFSQEGFGAKVVHIPGHSKGSIGILLKNGDLLCGDFLYAVPGMNYVDDSEARAHSLMKLQKLGIKKVFPGHGKPVEQLR
jgi:hydroxyacylglutathione hydrolase